jgi:hypothetical protein
VSLEYTYLCNKQELHQLKNHIPYHLTKLFNVTEISIQFGFKKTHTLMGKEMFKEKMNTRDFGIKNCTHNVHAIFNVPLTHYMKNIFIQMCFGYFWHWYF